MNKENASKLWKIIQEAGDYLEGQLPDHPNHPKGRNSYAHVAICVKDKFQMSYKDIDDDFRNVNIYFKNKKFEKNDFFTYPRTNYNIRYFKRILENRKKIRDVFYRLFIKYWLRKF